MTFIAYGFVLCLGLCVGSFLNVCIYRLPRDLSLVRPGSHCPQCNECIAWYDNIPVASWLFLGGLCRRCGALISARYLLVEALTGLVFVWLYSAHRSAGSGAAVAHLPTLGAYMALAGGLIVASFVDIERMIIPDEVSLGGMYVGPVLCVIWPSVIERDDLLTQWFVGVTGAAGVPGLAALAASVLGVAAGALVVYAAGVFGKALFRKEAMGLGDVKFMAMAGAFLGWQGAVLAFLLGCVFGAVVGIVLLIRRRDTHIPFGPYLACGTLAVMLHKPWVIRAVFGFPEALRSWFSA